MIVAELVSRRQGESWLIWQVLGDAFPLVTVTVAPPGMTGWKVESVCACTTNIGLTVAAAVRVTVQVSVPLHPPPDQPANVELDPAAAVSTTWVPWSHRRWP